MSKGISNMERIQMILSQLEYWGLDDLNQDGVVKWTEDIYWLIDLAIRSERYLLALELIKDKNIDNPEIDNILNTVLINK